MKTKQDPTTIEKEDIFNLDLGEGAEGIIPGVVESDAFNEEEEIEKKPLGRPPKKKEEEEEIIDEKKDKKEKKKVEISSEEIEESITQEKEEKKEPEDIDDTEVITPFVDLFAEKLGWELSDEEKPKTIDELVDFMASTIEQNSKPQYHDPIVEQFDEYMKNGGDPKRFIEVNYMVPEYDKLDVKKEDHQKKIVKDYYRLTGMKDEKIDKTIKRLSEDNELEDEAVELQKELVDLTSKEKETILKRQEQERTARDEQQRQSVAKVIDTIKKTTEINGIPLTDKDKKELVPYLFARGDDGLTPLQREAQKDPLEYAITTAFLFKNREKLKQSIDNKAKTGAADILRQRVKDERIRLRSKSDQSQVSDDDDNDWLSSYSKRIIEKPK